jgi:hypothetical protein
VKRHFATSTVLFVALAALSTSQPAAQEPSASTTAPSLDFEFFQTRVEPIFLKKRPGHARCYFCHLVEPGAIAGARLGASSTFQLEKLSPGSSFWTEEQSRHNFDVVSRLVTPGEPESSRLLMHPLNPDAGGQQHGGGRQFMSKDDPDRQTLAEWVRGQKAGGSSDK